MPYVPPEDPFYWPLGGIDYSAEVLEEYPDEAQLLGAITILWNRQDLALRRLFTSFIASRRQSYVEAIWDRQPTHKARRDLLELALGEVRLTRRERGILRWILDETKRLADRRNELIHAEYVVEAATAKLHARIKSPRSKSPPKHQRATTPDLQQVLRDVDRLLQATEAAWLEFGPTSVKKVMRTLRKLAEGREQSP